MNFLIITQAELLKTKRTLVWWLCFAIAGVAPLISIIDYYYQENIADKLQGGNPWSLYIEHANQLFNILLLPMLVILLSTLLAQIEYRNNTWKQVLTSPQSKITLFLSRFGTLLIMIVFTLFCFDLFTICVAVLIDFIKPGYNFLQHHFETLLLVKVNFKSFVGILGVAAIQYWLSLRIKNFIVPILIGVISWMVTAVLTFEVRWTHADLLPYTYTIFPAFAKFDHKLMQILLSSTSYCIAFLIIGYFDFRRPRIKQ